MRTAFCLEMLFSELPFLERLPRAREEGIENIEFWDWRDKDLEAISGALASHKMHVSNISGNRRYGMIDPRERTFFLKEVAETAQVARTLGCSRLMLLVQALTPDGAAVPFASGSTRSQTIARIVDCGLELAGLSSRENVEFVIEPLNTATDHPEYFLNSSGTAFEIIEAIGHPRVRVLYDIYHMAVMGEDYLRDIETHLDTIGYFHVADAPGRGEPGSGSIRYKEVFTLLRKLDYRGFIGFEFSPTNGRSGESIRKALAALE